MPSQRLVSPKTPFLAGTDVAYLQIAMIHDSAFYRIGALYTIGPVSCHFTCAARRGPRRFQVGTWNFGMSITLYRINPREKNRKCSSTSIGFLLFSTLSTSSFQPWPLTSYLPVTLTHTVGSTVTTAPVCCKTLQTQQMISCGSSTKSSCALIIAAHGQGSGIRSERVWFRFHGSGVGVRKPTFFSSKGVSG